MVLGIHENLLIAPTVVCPPVSGWRAQFLHAVRPLQVACLGETEISISPNPSRAPLTAGAVLEFQDYGGPYASVTLAEDLAPTDAIANVEPLQTNLYTTARAAVGA